MPLPIEIAPRFHSSSFTLDPPVHVRCSFGANRCFGTVSSAMRLEGVPLAVNGEQHEAEEFSSAPMQKRNRRTGSCHELRERRQHRRAGAPSVELFSRGTQSVVRPKTRSYAASEGDEDAALRNYTRALCNLVEALTSWDPRSSADAWMLDVHMDIGLPR